MAFALGFAELFFRSATVSIGLNAIASFDFFWLAVLHLSLQKKSLIQMAFKLIWKKCCELRHAR